jgi:DNA repair protein REV1
MGPGGYATCDATTIGECAWRLLRSLDFDPKELRGIGIQIQKLEKTSSGTESGQAVLPFKTVRKKDALSVPEVVVHPPSSQGESLSDTIRHSVDKGKGRASSVPIDIDLPPFSQVDKSVYDALPDEVKRELDAEYKRRSLSPAFDQMRDTASTTRDTHSEPPAGKDSEGSTTVELRKNITQHPVPKNGALLPLDKPKVVSKRSGPSYLSVNISDDELRALGIDPTVFSMLPMDVKREQLAGAKVAKTTGFLPLAGIEPRAIIKPIKRKARSPYLNKPPFPKARFSEQQVLKRQGNNKGEKLVVCDAEDIQAVLGNWVEGFREHPPNQRDVSYFGNFLVDSVDSALSGDVGVEKAIKVIKWWQLLLRRYWALWETVDIEGLEEIERNSEGRWNTEMVGRAWWRAFRSVKSQMDVSARKKFGGSLSLR